MKGILKIEIISKIAKFVKDAHSQYFIRRSDHEKMILKITREHKKMLLKTTERFVNITMIMAASFILFAAVMIFLMVSMKSEIRKDITKLESGISKVDSIDRSTTKDF